MRSGMYGYIGTGDVLFYMYNHSTGNWHYEQRRIVRAADRTEQKDSFSVPECTPLHRELTRMLAHNMSLSEKTLTNWLDKVTKFLYKMLPALKAKALEAGTAVNCDETCKINGISTIEYYKKLLSELLTGNNKTRTLFAHSVGFENASLLPQTIGIKR